MLWREINSRLAYFQVFLKDNILFTYYTTMASKTPVDRIDPFTSKVSIKTKKQKRSQGSSHYRTKNTSELQALPHLKGKLCVKIDICVLLEMGVYVIMSLEVTAVKRNCLHFDCFKFDSLTLVIRARAQLVHSWCWHGFIGTTRSLIDTDLWSRKGSTRITISTPKLNTFVLKLIFTVRVVY